MNRRVSTRRGFLVGTTTAATALAGCSESAESDDSGGAADSAGGSGSTATDGDDPVSTAASGDGASDGASATATDSGPDPNCDLLTGTPTPADVSGTSFVFQFEYVDTWTLQDPLSGTSGRLQAIASPTVTVDGETESASVQVNQSHEALTESEAKARIDELTGTEYARFEVLEAQAYGDEQVEVLGYPDVDLPTYLLLLPHDSPTGRQYYELQLTTLSSILRVEDEQTVTLCNEAVAEVVETIRGSLQPNPETAIDEV